MPRTNGTNPMTNIMRTLLRNPRKIEDPMLLASAIRRHGSGRKLALHIGVTNSYISQLKRAKQLPDTIRTKLLEDAAANRPSVSEIRAVGLLWKQIERVLDTDPARADARFAALQTFLEQLLTYPDIGGS